MNWDAISAIANVLSGLAVIATLVYLARQVRDSARQQRMDSQRAISEEFNRINEFWLDLENTGMYVRALADWDGATPQERHILGVFFIKAFNHLQTMFLMWENGTVDDSVYESEEEFTCAFLAASGGKRWWELFESSLSQRFRDRINTKLSTGNYTPVTDIVPYWRAEDWPRSQ